MRLDSNLEVNLRTHRARRHHFMLVEVLESRRRASPRGPTVEPRSVCKRGIDRYFEHILRIDISLDRCHRDRAPQSSGHSRILLKLPS
ncbi:hypothetical protein PC116_g3565 [Phytophthora cactorum]|uniref:Uncharacterized protein n=1 Tax=Phytophthora cactorum TaxID=29920 RepID=A0A8T1BU63_9STRA|nr:hypothetical protein PC111_g18861 [Phytophthora cactorum]KAG2819348.1 hypothetical protein PC112_g12216 [Phytophthora cactorum]KAG2855126.1 hypothetical protein PC113_g12707 [Phytophthora cactorum]KAG2891677.1 hypothetical protein PC114_g16921 [Phytophthora cactorum]KAG2905073.1 hypothetical protein PC115_g14769 [Phytophthora cactorum]